MSSVSVFQPYIDKENTGTRHKQRNGSVIENRGKVFQSQGPSLTTPRSALRDVFNDLSLTGQKIKPQKPHAPVNELFKEPAPRKELSVRPLEQSRQKLTNKNVESRKQKSVTKPLSSFPQQKVITRKPEPLPDIELIYIYDVNDEIKQQHDKDVSSFVDRLKKWRPPCLFGSQPDRGDEDEEMEEMHADIFNLPEPEFTDADLGLTVEPFDEEELVALPDIQIAGLDDLPIPFFDDSIDIEPNMGTLEIYDSSTPYTLSPSCK